MDTTKVSGTLDTGSIPVGTTPKLHRLPVQFFFARTVSNGGNWSWFGGIWAAGPAELCPQASFFQTRLCCYSSVLPLVGPAGYPLLSGPRVSSGTNPYPLASNTHLCGSSPIRIRPFWKTSGQAIWAPLLPGSIGLGIERKSPECARNAAHEDLHGRARPEISMAYANAFL